MHSPELLKGTLQTILLIAKDRVAEFVDFIKTMSTVLQVHIKGVSKNSLYPSLPEKGDGLRP